MFTYLSLLIDRGFFDVIHVNFLIVGHTHTSIDQYFSLVSKAIKRCNFIGSPLSLRKLFGTVGDPLVNRKLSVFYNYKDWLEKVINTTLKWYNLPHVFRFRRVYGRCICQHKPYSTSPVYLPEEPESCKTLEDIEASSRNFQIDECSILGGEAIIKSAIVGNTKCSDATSGGLISNEAVNAAVSLIDLSKIQGNLNSILCASAYEQMKLHENESEVGHVVKSNEFTENVSGYNEEDRMRFRIAVNNTSEELNRLQQVQNDLKSMSDPKKGYCFWIDYNKCDAVWLKSKPRPLNPCDEVSLNDIFIIK